MAAPTYSYLILLLLYFLTVHTTTLKCYGYRRLTITATPRNTLTITLGVWSTVLEASPALV